jgi:hypothetical protein
MSHTAGGGVLTATLERVTREDILEKGLETWKRAWKLGKGLGKLG